MATDGGKKNCNSEETRHRRDLRSDTFAHGGVSGSAAPSTSAVSCFPDAHKGASAIASSDKTRAAGGGSALKDKNPLSPAESHFQLLPRARGGLRRLFVCCRLRSHNTDHPERKHPESRGEECPDSSVLFLSPPPQPLFSGAGIPPAQPEREFFHHPS